MGSAFQEFDMGLTRFEEETVPNAVRDLRDAVGLETARGVVLMTPVLSGRLRGNWQTTVGTAAEGHTEDEDPAGAATINRADAAIQSARHDPFAKIWLHNGLPYAKVINDGDAGRRAVRMVEVTVSRIRRMFR